jgi:hypothetical protein
MNFEKIYESEQLMEMAALRKASSKLPVNLYLDDSMSYKRGRHSKRIKFQTDYSDKPITGSFSTMKFDGEIVEKTVHGSSLSQKDVTQIQNFIKNNLAALESLADMNIEIEDFKRIMIPGGEPAIEEAKNNQLTALQAFLNPNP